MYSYVPRSLENDNALHKAILACKDLENSCEGANPLRALFSVRDYFMNARALAQLMLEQGIRLRPMFVPEWADLLAKYGADFSQEIKGVTLFSQSTGDLRIMYECGAPYEQIGGYFHGFVEHLYQDRFEMFRLMYWNMSENVFWMIAEMFW